MTVKAKVTLTWVADPASDPAPPSVWVVETGDAVAAASGAGATSSASDGITGDVYVKDSPATDQDSGGMATPSGLPGGGRLRKLSSGAFSFDINLSASGNSNYTAADIFPDIESATVSYSLAIHAQPYHWYNAGWSSNGNDPDNTTLWNSSGGTLSFRYKWLSSDGVLADLTSIDIYENVDYTGNPGRFTNYTSGPNYYYPSNPPIGDVPTQNGTVIGFHVENPEVSHADAKLGFTQDGHSAWPTKTPLSVFSCVAPQKYEFDDSVTNETKVLLYDAGSITDAVQISPNKFVVSKSGGTATTPL